MAFDHTGVGILDGSFLLTSPKAGGIQPLATKSGFVLNLQLQTMLLTVLTF